MNKPSDGSMRRVSNAILLVEKPKAEENDPGTDNPGTDNPGTDAPGTGDPIDPPGMNCTPPDDHEDVSPFLQFFINIWEAIVNFFNNLFGKKD
jgi:hypothetical protein